LGEKHAAVYDTRPEVDGIALCDTRREAAEKVAATLRKPTTLHTSIDDLFSSERVDVVSILTPDHLHRKHAEAACAAGVQILLTKPIAPTLPDARAIVASARKARVHLMIHHEMRFRSIYPRAKELIASGRLGDIAYIGITELYQYVREKFANAPWYATRESGRTMVTGSGVHQVDMLRWLCGRPVRRVTALGNRVGDLPYWHNKTIVALLEFEGVDSIGELTFSYEGMPCMARGGLTVIGSKGMISLEKFRDRVSGQEESLKPDHEEDSHQAGVHAFLDALRDGRPVPITGEDGFDSVAAAHAIDVSCETGQTAKPEQLQESAT
jgi:predicted dehydrogenase